LEGGMSNVRNRLGNPVMSLLLHSPLHSLLSKNVLLITVTGRRSGRAYTTPVGYVQSGDELLIVSSPDRTWWKNLRGGATVKVRWQGRDLTGHGLAVEDQTEVAADLIVLLKAAPQYQKYLAVSLTPDGQPIDPAALSKAAQSTVMVKISELQP
jgi:deazaflavin-dependent oxidoreductase (nitroreductase family)